MSDRPSGAARHTLPSAVLLLLAETPGHGYALEERLVSLGYRALAAGAVYRELRRLEAEGAIRSVWELSEEHGPRRTYEITAFGLERLEQRVDEMRCWVDTLDDMLDRHRQRQAGIAPDSPRPREQSRRPDLDPSAPTDRDETENPTTRPPNTTPKERP